MIIAGVLLFCSWLHTAGLDVRLGVQGNDRLFATHLARRPSDIICFADVTIQFCSVSRLLVFHS